MKIYNKSEKNKIISIFLAFSMVLGYSHIEYGDSAVFAADKQLSGFVSIIYDSDSSSYSVFSDDENASCYLENTGSGLIFYHKDSDGTTLEDEIDGNIPILVSSDLTLQVYDADTYILVSGANVEYYGNNSGNISAESGNIFINGTFSADQIDISGEDVTLNISSGARLELEEDYSFSGITINAGTIAADRLDISELGMLESSESAAYEITRYFSKGETNLNGKVVTDNPKAFISSTGGSFILELSGEAVEVDEAVDNSAENIVDADKPQVSLERNDNDSEIYYGTNYDLTSLYDISSDYDGDLEISYYTTYSETPIEKPSAKGYYRYSIDAPRTAKYKSNTTGITSFNIDYIDTPSEKPTVEGIVNEKYVKDTITLTAPENMEIHIEQGGSEYDGYHSSVEIPESFDWGTETPYTLKILSDDPKINNAITDYIDLKNLIQNYNDLVFDSDPPEITVIVDGEETDWEDLGAVIAENVKITVKDDNLYKVNIEDGVTLNDDLSGLTEYNLEFESEEGNPREIPLHIEDLAGNEIDFSFLLINPNDERTEPEIQIDEIGTVFVGTDYDFTENIHFPEDYNGEWDIEYYKNGDSVDKPGTMEPASYSFKVIAGSTGNYLETESEEIDFSIAYLTPPANAVTLSGVEDGRVMDKLIVQPASGFRISDNARSSDYFSELVLTEEDLFTDGVYNDSFGIYFMRSDDGALTDRVLLKDVAPEVTSLKFGEEEIEEEEEPTEETTEEPTEESTEEPEKKEASASVSIEDQYYGVNYTPELKTDSDGADRVIYQYYNEARTAAYSSAPTAPGKYIVQAIIPETDNYKSVQCDDTYEISYLPAPAKAYSISGKKGNNDYYITEVSLIAPDGYEIAARLDGEYSTAIRYTDITRSVYLRKSDGAKTGAIRVTDEIKVDTHKPLLSVAQNQSGQSIEAAGEVYADSITMTITDEHLKSVSMNGGDITVKGDKAELVLDPENGHKDFVINAEDDAGNKLNINVDLSALWLKEKIIPGGVNVTLEGKTVYILGQGNWMVSGDSTVYSGGFDVYVDSDGKYIFTQY